MRADLLTHSGQKPGDLHQVALQARFERLVAVDRNREPEWAARFCVDVVAAVDPLQRPPVEFQHSSELFTRDGLHSASSIT